MKRDRKWLLGISIALSIGAVFWMRALASWRPVVVAKVDFAATQLKFSRDGRLLLSGDEGAAILNVKSGFVDSNSEHMRDLLENQSLVAYPRLAFDERAERVVFCPSPQKQVMLRDLGIGRDVVGIENGESPRYGWSKLRREVYAAFMGEIYTWNWDDGKLKRRVRYAKQDNNQFAFSPDGKWLMATDADKAGKVSLRRYEMQTGKMVGIIGTALGFPKFGFSPDGRTFWFCQGSRWQVDYLQWIRTSDFQFPQGATCSDPVKCLPDGRIGFVRPQSFDLITADYSSSRVLPGPFDNGRDPARTVKDWALSPDENWIYSAHNDGTIRKWRAR